VSLPTSTPSAHGVDAAGITGFLDAVAAAGIELHSIAIARHGHVIAEGWWEPYRADRVHLLYSLSKSLTATTVATLVAEGAISLDDPVLDHLPIDGIDVDPRWNSVRVKHCLSMTVGHTEDAWLPVMMAIEAGDTSSFLAHVLRNGPDAEPGTVFCYNQVATYVLSRIVAHVTGRHLTDVLRERVLDPLGVGELLWHRCPEGYELGFTGAHLATRDLHRVVQLWLDRGSADGVELVPAAWYDEATIPFLPMPPDDTSDWAQGYGYSYWIARHGYRGDGAYGQYGMVLAEHGVAIAITSEVLDMQSVLDLAWAHLLPAFDRSGSEADDEALAARLASASIPALGGASGAPMGGTFDLVAGSDLPESYSSITVTPGEGGHLLTFTIDGDAVGVPVGSGTWADGALANGHASVPTAASGGWDDGRFVAHVRIVETPHSIRIEADPATATATARWVLPPLSGPDPLFLAVRPA
jgi:CubicO group peptidase (beta-lactamase class C family)